MLVPIREGPDVLAKTHKIAIATDKQLKFIEHLQRTWSNEVGFLPRSAIKRYIQQRCVLLVEQNKQYAGYLLWQLTRKGLLRVVQLAVEPELLRERLGTDIMSYIETAAKKGSCSIVRLQTRIDINANIFFREVGFTTTAVFHRATTRNRPIIEWTKSLLDPATLTDALIERRIKYKRRAKIIEPSIVHPATTIM